MGLILLLCCSLYLCACLYLTVDNMQSVRDSRLNTLQLGAAEEAGCVQVEMHCSNLINCWAFMVALVAPLCEAIRAGCWSTLLGFWHISIWPQGLMWAQAWLQARLACD